MKILFALTVLIAGIYLFVEQDSFTELRQYLPLNQINQKTEILLKTMNQNVNNKVDEQINKSLEVKFMHFKKHLMAENLTKISLLENKLAYLQTKLLDLNTRIVNEHSQSQPDFAASQILTEGSSSTLNAPTLLPTLPIKDNQAKKQQAIARQASLQDIAARMHKAAMLSLIH